MSASGHLISAYKWRPHRPSNQKPKLFAHSAGSASGSGALASPPRFPGTFDRYADIYGIRALESCRARQNACSICAERLPLAGRAQTVALTNSIARRDAHEHRRSNGSSHLPDPDRDATRHFGRMRNRGHAPRGARSRTGARTARCPDFTPLTSRYTTIQISPTRGATIRNGLTCSSRFGSRNAVSESAR
jgi:hypothetical protein